MRKALMFMVLGLFVISMVSVVSARTIITGTVYNPDLGVKVGDANVTVACTNGDDFNYRYTASASSGSNIGDYYVEFNEEGNDACNGGDSVTVIAVKGDLSGVETEIVVDDAIWNLDVAIINIPITPEFGFVLGVMTLVSAVGVFFVVRKD
ncbi:MAG: hypothetical protein KAI72_01745 [Candidatus Pacebacteria bacterium]|nr:hypothetical protein [Candidatus Paceibacterota bacterium]